MQMDAFAHALQLPDAPLPRGLFARSEASSARRFAIYRNNMAVSLVDALCANFPVCVKLVGEDFFCAMARVYVEDNKPASPLIQEYGGSFAHFIERFAPAACVPYLADVARLEFARLSAYHAADRLPLGVSEFAALDPGRLAEVRIEVHPAMRVVRSSFAVVSICAAHHNIVGIESVDPFVPENGLVTRAAYNVETTVLGPGEATFLERLASGDPLGFGAECALSEDPHFNLAQALCALMTTGAAASFIHAHGGEDDCD